MVSYDVMSTEFQLGKMRKFWRQMAVRVTQQYGCPSRDCTVHWKKVTLTCSLPQSFVKENNDKGWDWKGYNMQAQGHCSTRQNPGSKISKKHSTVQVSRVPRAPPPRHNVPGHTLKARWAGRYSKATLKTSSGSRK